MYNIFAIKQTKKFPVNHILLIYKSFSSCDLIQKIIYHKTKIDKSNKKIGKYVYIKIKNKLKKS